MAWGKGGREGGREEGRAGGGGEWDGAVKATHAACIQAGNQLTIGSRIHMSSPP